MKRIGTLLLALLLLAGLFGACTLGKESQKKEEQAIPNNEESEADQSSYYSISYNTGALDSNFISKPKKAKAGKTVEIKTVILYDADIHVYVEGKEVPKTAYDDYWGYSFAMPEHNVVVTCHPYEKQYFNSEASETTYTITYDLGDHLADFIELPTKAKAGAIVEIKTVVLYDADKHVYVDGEEIEKTHYDSDYWGYTFTMPKQNVTVTCRPYTKAEIWGTE